MTDSANNESQQMNESELLELLDKAETIASDEENNISSNDEQVDDRALIQNDKSFTLMVNYIKDHKTDIPEEFRGSVLIEEETGLTLSMYWIYTMKTFSVPKWMRMDPNITDSHGWTLAFHYIYVNQVDPPLWMKHDPTIQNNNKRTIAMYYLIHRKTELTNRPIPEWMIHSPCIFDSAGYSIIDYWLATNTDPIPLYILQQIEDVKTFVNGRNERIVDSFKLMRNNEQPPEEFI